MYLVKQYQDKKLLLTELQQSTHSLFFYIICSLTLFVLFAQQVLFDVVHQGNSVSSNTETIWLKDQIVYYYYYCVLCVLNYLLLER